MTQAQLADLVNKNRVSITNYETGRSTPPGDVVLRIIKLRFPKLLCAPDEHNAPIMNKTQVAIKVKRPSQIDRRAEERHHVGDRREATRRTGDDRRRGDRRKGERRMSTLLQ